MRPAVALLASGLTLALHACASKPAPVSTSPLAQCPYKVVATVSNPTNRNYDVYYQDGRTRSMLGEIVAGGTNTFPLPGEGRGYVSAFGSQADGGGRAPSTATRGVRIRVHCEGA